MDDIWQGAGIWTGWKITTDNPASSNGQPVLVDPDGIVYGPDDIISFAHVMTAPEAAIKWNIPKSTVRNNAAAGKFLPTEARQGEKTWIITRKGMLRVFGNKKKKSKQS